MKTTRHGKQRFRLQEFTNPRTQSRSWRVTGIKRNGERVRQNFQDAEEARLRHVELEGEYWSGETENLLRSTRLTQDQLRIAEAAFVRLEQDQDLVLAVDHWLRHGQPRGGVKTVRLDEAVKKFNEWLDNGNSFREATRRNLKTRVKVFSGMVPNLPLSEITPDTVDDYLQHRKVSAASQDNDRRALSRFFRYCIERPRRWMSSNPCREVRVEREEKEAPTVLTVDECKELLKAAKSYRDGRLVPYVAVCLFGGLRPVEAARLTWGQVNLEDGEIRIEATQSKTKRARVVEVCSTLKAWLKRYKGKPFYPSNWRKDFDAIKEAIGYGTTTDKKPDLKPWPSDVLRHTGVSHYFRRCGSCGKTAEWAGNSEAIIKGHYQGRVSSKDTKDFYALKPGRKL